MSLDQIMDFYKIENYTYEYITNTLKISETVSVSDFVGIKTQFKKYGIVLNNIIVEAKDNGKKASKEKESVKINFKQF